MAETLNDHGHLESALAGARAQGGFTQLEFPIGKVLYKTAGWIGDPRISPKGDRIAFLAQQLGFQVPDGAAVAGIPVLVQPPWPKGSE